MSIICVGDLHFSDARPWSYDVSKEVVKYLIQSPFNNKDNTLVLLGDLTETAFLSGYVTDLLLNLFSNLNYNKVYVLVGNHDRKPNKQGKLVLSYRFLKSKNVHKLFPNTDITVIEDMTEIDIEGQKCLFLPYLFSDSTLTWKDYEELKTEADIVFGHFTDNSEMDFKDRTVDITGIKARYICLGHQHNPASNYIGSVVPNSTAESGRTRSIWIFNKGERTKEKIPEFTAYYNVDFPEPLPKTNVKYPIYSFSNCASPEIAKEHYGDIFVYKTLYKASVDVEGLKDLGVLSNEKEEFSNQKLFSMWCTESKHSPSILDLARSYMTTN